jgi:hypothetical protein
MQVRAMRNPTHSRRDVLKASAAMAAGAVFAEPLKAATAEPSAVTPALIEAARKEGKISFYTALELPTSERLGKAFEVKYPGIPVRVERSGAERIFQRIGSFAMLQLPRRESGTKAQPKLTAKPHAITAGPMAIFRYH